MIYVSEETGNRLLFFFPSCGKGGQHGLSFFIAGKEQKDERQNEVRGVHAGHSPSAPGRANAPGKRSKVDSGHRTAGNEQNGEGTVFRRGVPLQCLRETRLLRTIQRAGPLLLLLRGKNGRKRVRSMKRARQERFWENVNRAVYYGHGAYGIPRMTAVKECSITDFVPFTEARKVPEHRRKQTGLHFYLDDYRFEQIWRNPDRVLPLLSGFGAVIAPDFSCYTDFPEALRIYAVYRNAWLGCWWQENGIPAIPQATWSAAETLAYAFDGIPEDSVVAVSSVGCMKNSGARALFEKGMRCLIAEKRPRLLLFHGILPEGMPGNIRRIPVFTDRFRKRQEGG